MTKEELKSLFEDYWYDNQYLKEKSKEIMTTNNYLANTDAKNFFDDSINYEKQQIALILHKKQHIESLIQTLNQPYKTLMYLKYITFLTFDQIADRMSYSTKRIYQLHNEAINKILEDLNKKDPNISKN
ncbi:MAG TPA: DUF1492 domain-containing protein [Candidatus Caccovivens faecavium]|nr:DUF1492 domain-containing protein [Candidatus Caccovivens faecavium]